MVGRGILEYQRTAAALGCALIVLGGGCYGGHDADPAGDGTDSTAGDESESADGSDEGVPEDLDPLSVLEPLAARLNDTQYRNTVFDVLGETLTAQELQWLPRDVPIEGSYSTSTAAQGFNAQYVLGYAYIARGITERLDLPALQMQQGGCQGADAACLEAFIAGLGLRLFRRPLTEAQLQTYLDLAAAIAADPDTTDDDVVRGVVQALMQAPQFLYRLERETEGQAGEVRRIDGYELASRLSYFLWQSAPDDALLTFAAGPGGDGNFDSEAMAAQVQRMLADAKFERARTNFWGDYTLASTSSFGSTDPELIDELRSSLLATLDRISGVDAPAEPLSAVFDGDTYVMTPAVAAIAGAESLGAGLQVYDVAQAEERLGVVTHPAFLAAIGTTSFVGRGVFMTERLLCQHTPPPPEDVAEDIMMTAMATEDLTPREASEFRFGLEPVCVGCHSNFEPIAYGFERYAIDGQYTLTDAQGRDLFSYGVLPAGGGRPEEIVFDDAQQLLGALGGQQAVHRCFVENMAEFGSGRPALWAGEFLTDSLTEFEDEGLTFDALVASIAGSDQRIYMRVVEVAP